MYTKQPFEESKKFKKIFNKNLHGYWSIIFGFDIVKFDNDLAVPDGTSTRHYVETHYGDEAVVLIEKLISM